MQAKTIGLISFQEIPADKEDYVRRELEREIGAALEEGYKTFLTEYVQGAGMIFTRCVKEQGGKYPDIYLEGILSYTKQCERFSRDEWELLSKCNGIKVLCDDCKQNYPLSVTRYLAGQSGRVIVIHDAQPDHDTAYAMDYARSMERDLRIIQI